MRDGERVYDLGTGAGFPGVLFAIRYPEIPIILYEKLAKKRVFLEDVIAKLALDNVTLEETMPPKRLKGLFMARAVYQMPELLDYMSKHLSDGARLILNRGGDTDFPALPSDFKLLQTNRYTLPLECGSRHVDSLQKI